MEIIKTELEGVFIIKNKIFQDERGIFIKTYNKDEFKKIIFVQNLEKVIFLFQIKM